MHFKNYKSIIEHTVYKDVICNNINIKGWRQSSIRAEFLYAVEVGINSN